MALDRSKVKLSPGFARLRGALARHGLPGVAAIAWRAVRGEGLAQTLRLASGDQPFLSVAGPKPDCARKAAAWPPRLDAAGTVSDADWRRWIKRPPGARDVGLSAPIVLVGDEGPDFTPEPDTFYVFQRAGDLPDGELFNALRLCIADGPAEIISFDLFRRLGDRVQPLLLPGANPTLLAQRDYLLSRAAVKGSVLLETGLHRPREAILAWCAGRTITETRARWRHIGRPLICIGPAEATADSPTKPSRPPPRRAAPGVSAVICTRDKGHLTRQLVRQLLQLDKAELAEVVILSNGTANPYALRTLDDLAREKRVQVIVADEPFNFSRLCNTGVGKTQGKGPLLFLNDDIAPVSEDWLASLMDQLQTPGTGAVGPLLLYPDERVQHAGMYLRLPTGVGHILRGAALPAEDPLGFAVGAREVSCLTGAVLLTDRAAFEAVGGFDEQLAISFQDVDYGLKLHQRGLRNIFEPKSILIHMESATLGRSGGDRQVLMQRYLERKLFLKRWSPIFGADPFYPAGLDLDDESGRRLAQGGPRA